ncbi:hypothetical protein BDY24DRAFT_416938 [Mrakia frigida]|uniref:uncharacterized protein n=1 Tax=Mrakia frigida TaxID=29902 RepID=UPI003FCC1632
MFSAVFLPFALSATLFFPLLVLGQVSTAPDAPPVGSTLIAYSFLRPGNYTEFPLSTYVDFAGCSRQPGCDRYMAFSDVSSPGGPFCGCPTTTLVGYGASRDGAGVRFIYFPSYGAWLFKGCGFIAGLEPSSSIMSGGEECSLFCNNRRVGVGSPVLFLYTAFNYATGACYCFNDYSAVTPGPCSTDGVLSQIYAHDLPAEFGAEAKLCYFQFNQGSSHFYFFWNWNSLGVHHQFQQRTSVINFVHLDIDPPDFEHPDVCLLRNQHCLNVHHQLKQSTPVFDIVGHQHPFDSILHCHRHFQQPTNLYVIFLPTSTTGDEVISSSTTVSNPSSAVLAAESSFVPPSSAIIVGGSSTSQLPSSLEFETLPVSGPPSAPSTSVSLITTSTSVVDASSILQPVPSSSFVDDTSSAPTPTFTPLPLGISSATPEPSIVVVDASSSEIVSQVLVTQSDSQIVTSAQTLVVPILTISTPTPEPSILLVTSVSEVVSEVSITNSDSQVVASTQTFSTPITLTSTLDSPSETPTASAVLLTSLLLSTNSESVVFSSLVLTSLPISPSPTADAPSSASAEPSVVDVAVAGNVEASSSLSGGQKAGVAVGSIVGGVVVAITLGVLIAKGLILGALTGLGIGAAAGAAGAAGGAAGGTAGGASSGAGAGNAATQTGMASTANQATTAGVSSAANAPVHSGISAPPNANPFLSAGVGGGAAVAAVGAGAAASSGLESHWGTAALPFRKRPVTNDEESQGGSPFSDPPQERDQFGRLMDD